MMQQPFYLMQPGFYDFIKDFEDKIGIEFNKIFI